MAGSSFFALFDDIAALLDDIAMMSKVAAQKTAGVLGDDLALNAQQVTGVNADRELPVVWAVTKGSLINKCILVPAALAISFFLPWLISPLLMVGGAYLCYEGAEKILHLLFHKAEHGAHHEALVEAVTNSDIDLVAFEKEKIKGAIRTDFILSAEIIVIAMGTMTDASFGFRAAALALVAFALTIGVYGTVAAIVKMDDVGLFLMRKTQKGLQALGRGLLWFAPKLMKGLSIFGTAAMFLVGGGILIHGVPIVAEAMHHLEVVLHSLPLGGIWSVLGTLLATAIGGLAAGCVTVAVVAAGGKVLAAGK